MSLFVQHNGGTLSWHCNALQDEGLPRDVSGLLEAVEQKCSQAGLGLPSDWQVLKDMVAEHWRTLLAETMPAWVQVGRDWATFTAALYAPGLLWRPRRTELSLTSGDHA